MNMLGLGNFKMICKSFIRICVYLTIFGMRNHTSAENFYVYVGNTAQLSCNTNETHPFWIGPEGFYNYQGLEQFNPTYDEKSNRLSWGKNKQDLLISNVRRNDSGNYTCNGINKYLFVRVSAKRPIFMNANESADRLDAIEGRTLTIACITRGGYPVPTVALYEETISDATKLSSNSTETLHSDNTYSVTLQHTFTPSASDDRKYLICRSYYPQADSAYQDSKNKTVVLYLSLKPSQPTVTQTSVVSTGDYVEVTCRTTGCRPAANISWLYNGSKTTGVVSLTLDVATETFTVVSVFTRNVTAADNGQSVQCIVTHPALIDQSQKTAALNLTVRFSAEASSTKITGNKEVHATGSAALTLTCTTGSSNPASDITWKNGSALLTSNRTYITSTGENNGVVRSQQLVLYPTRYMDGDVIICTVSNEVSQYDVVDNITLDLKFPPYKPSNVSVIDIHSDKISLSWIRGYHGGYAQTFVIQYSIDLNNWTNVTFDGGKDESEQPITGLVSGLQSSTMYYVRMYAFNEEGNSEYTETLNLTTISSSDKGSGPSSSAVIGGAASGGSAIVLIVVIVVAVVILKRRGYLTKGKAPADDYKSDRRAVYADENEYGMQDMYEVAGPRKSDLTCASDSDDSVAVHSTVDNKKLLKSNMNDVHKEVGISKKTKENKGESNTSNLNEVPGKKLPRKDRRVGYGLQADKRTNIHVQRRNDLEADNTENIALQNVIKDDQNVHDQPKDNKKLAVHGFDSMAEHDEVDGMRKTDLLSKDDMKNHVSTKL